jgi:hypothetical protein
LFEYDMGGKLIRTLTMPEGYTADQVQKLKDNYYVADRTQAFDFLYLEGTTFRVIYNLQDVGSWVTLRDKAYVQANGVAYEFVAGDRGMFGLHSVFSSSKVAVSELFLAPSGLLLTGHPEGDDTSGKNVYTLSKDAPPDPTPNDNKPAQTVQGEPTYKGFDELLENGVSTEQIENIKLAIGRYLTSAKKQPQTISVNDVSTQYSQTSPASIATFTVAFDDQFYSARMDYNNTATIRLTLTETFGSKKQIFDSGPVGQ